MRSRLAALALLLALPATADSQVRQRAVEETGAGVFIRGGAVVVNADPRCPEGCPEGQACRQACEDRPCAADAPDGAVCSECTWRCE